MMYVDAYIGFFFGVCNIFFFEQKTAYELRISDWSSDVCSSDLRRLSDGIRAGAQRRGAARTVDAYPDDLERPRHQAAARGRRDGLRQIGRASCRERVCQYV